MLVADNNSIATLAAMRKTKKQLDEWQYEDAERLKSLFAVRAGKSQADFGAEFEIGSQGMVWQYLNAHRPLNISAAQGFARGLQVGIDEFSPTLAAQIRQASGVVTSEKPKAAQDRATDSAEKLPLFGESIPVVTFHSGVSPTSDGTENVSSTPQYSLDKNDFRPVYVIDRPQGGMPESLWDGETLVGATEQFAVLATKDPRAFIVPVLDDSMFPRLMPGEYVLVQPDREPDIEDTVFVRLKSGDTVLRRLLSRRDSHVRLGAWNDTAVQSFREEEVSWVYTVAHAVPAWMIKRGASGA